MAKERYLLSLDADIKEKLACLASERRMSISTYITQLVLEQKDPICQEKEK